MKINKSFLCLLSWDGWAGLLPNDVWRHVSIGQSGVNLHVQSELANRAVCYICQCKPRPGDSAQQQANNCTRK